MSSYSASRVLDISGTSRSLTARMVGPGPDGIGLPGRTELAGEERAVAGNARDRRPALVAAHSRLAERARPDLGVAALQHAADDQYDTGGPPRQAGEAERRGDHG